MSSVNSDYALDIEGSFMFGFAAVRCVEFAFQNLGIDVCPIIPANYTTHFFYEHYTAKKLSTKDIDDIYKTLKKNGLHKRFTIIKSGYLETCEELRKVAEIVADIKKANPTAIFVCDPVKGDNGAEYVTITGDIAPIFKDLLFPLADIVTPNHFEVELFSGMKVQNETDTMKALQIIHDMGPDVVIMTSGKINTKSAKKQALVGSRWKDGKREVYRIDFNYIDGYFVGTGDLFTGCFVGYLRQSDDFKTSLEKAISTLQYVCQRTHLYAMEHAGPGNKPTFEQMELRVVQCAAFLREPKITHPATKLK